MTRMKKKKITRYSEGENIFQSGHENAGQSRRVFTLYDGGEQFILLYNQRNAALPQGIMQD